MSHHHEHHVVVNGEEKTTDKHELTFHEVCKLAYPEGPFRPNITYTVTFTLPDGKEGSMIDVERIEVINGTIFTVANADKS